MNLEAQIKLAVRDIPDFPKPGIVFKDLSVVLLQPALCDEIVKALSVIAEGARPDFIACVESRGYWFGMSVARTLKLPVVVIRKKGKLPSKTVSITYDLEYGTEILEMNADAPIQGKKVWIHDDLLATGGTAAAVSSLIEAAGGITAGFGFVAELSFLEGKKKIASLTSASCASLAVY